MANQSITINNLKVYPRNIRRHRKMCIQTLIGAAIISGVITAAAVGVNSATETAHIKNSTVAQVMTEYKGVSDITGDLNKAAFGDVETLEKYLDLSEVLHDLDLDKNIVYNIEGATLMSPEDIYTMVDIYKDGGDNKTRVTKPLTEQEQLVNQYIATQGYGIAASVCKDTLKAVIADAKEEMTGEEYEKKDITIPEYHYSSYPEDLFVEGMTLRSNSHVELLLESLYDMQTQTSRVYDNGTKSPETCRYNKDRNRKINTALNRLKIVLSHDYTANKSGTIKTSN